LTIYVDYVENKGMVSSRDISVVVQGPIVKGEERAITTQKCLENIRSFLPDSEIILSTWNGADVAGLSFDVLVLNDDPGQQLRPDGKPFNVNRQIVSAREGLKRVQRPYAIKLRSDSLIVSKKFVQQFETFTEKKPAPTLFQNRVVICTLYSRNPAKIDCPLLYHPTDWFNFGRTTDLLDLWDIPLHGDELIADRWEKWRYAPEQWVWISFLRKKGYKINLRRSGSFTIHDLWISESSIIHNFAIFPPALLGVEFSTPNTGVWHNEAVYTFGEWNDLSRTLKTRHGIIFRLTHVGIMNYWRRAKKFTNHIFDEVRHYRVRAIVKLKKIMGKI
jgi:hypothetical protein